MAPSTSPSTSPSLLRLRALRDRLNLGGALTVEAFDAGNGGVRHEYVIRTGGVTYKLGRNREDAAEALRAFGA